MNISQKRDNGFFTPRKIERRPHYESKKLYKVGVKMDHTGLEPVRAYADGLEDHNASNYVLAVHTLIIFNHLNIPSFF